MCLFSTYIVDIVRVQSVSWFPANNYLLIFYGFWISSWSLNINWFSGYFTILTHINFAVTNYKIYVDILRLWLHFYVIIWLEHILKENLIGGNVALLIGALHLTHIVDMLLYVQLPIFLNKTHLTVTNQAIKTTYIFMTLAYLH